MSKNYGFFEIIFVFLSSNNTVLNANQECYDSSSQQAKHWHSATYNKTV